MKKTGNLIIRIIASPLILGIILIKYNYHAFRNTFLAIIYGGEWITYAKDDKITIQDIYVELKKQNETSMASEKRN